MSRALDATEDSADLPIAAKPRRLTAGSSMDIFSRGSTDGKSQASYLLTDQKVPEQESLQEARKKVSDAFAEQGEIYSERRFRSDPAFKDVGGHIDVAERVILDNGDLAWLKPAWGETEARLGLEPGQGVRHNIASFEIDKALGLGVTPAIELVRTDLGEATLQKHVPNDALPVDMYDDQSSQRMALLDYVTGQTDRHARNYLTDDTGAPAAIDNGLCLSDGVADPIVSDFVASWFQRPLDDEVLAPLDHYDAARLEGKLSNLGISQEVISAMTGRIAEVRENRRITGTAWQGRIYSGNRDTVL